MGRDHDASAHVLVQACLREELEELQFPQRAQTKESVVERKDLFDGDLTTGGLMECGSDRSIGTLPNSVQELVILA